MEISGMSTLYYRFIGLAVKLAGSGIAVEKFSNIISTVRCAVSRVRNNLLSAHLTRIFPYMNDSQIKKTILDYWKMHERNIFTLFYLKNKIYDDIAEDVTWIGKKHLDSAFDSKKGVLLLVPHFGDEKSLHVILGMNGYPVTVMTSRYSDMPAYVRDCRLETGMKWNNLHFPDENPRWMYRTLEGGRILHYAPTAYGGPGGKWINSFGIPVLVPSAPWRIWKHTGCRILFASCRQTPGMGFELQFTPIDSLNDSVDFAQAIGHATEELALQDPSQYEWKTLLIRHWETNIIARIGRIPSDERELEQLAEPDDENPSRILPLKGIMDSLY